MTVTMRKSQEPMVNESDSPRVVSTGSGARRTSPVRWQQQLKHLLKLSEAQVVLGWGVILVLAALLGTIYLVQASHIAEIGRRVQTLQIQLAENKRQNSLLERKIAEAQSLERLQRTAIQLGFVQASPEDIEYLIVPNYPAAPETENIPEITPTPKQDPIERVEEALWLALQSRFSDLRRGESRE